MMHGAQKRPGTPRQWRGCRRRCSCDRLNGDGRAAMVVVTGSDPTTSSSWQKAVAATGKATAGKSMKHEPENQPVSGDADAAALRPGKAPWAAAVELRSGMGKCSWSMAPALSSAHATSARR